MAKLFHTIWKKSSQWSKLSICLILILFLTYMFENTHQRREGFEQRKKYILRKNRNLYDDFYVDYYDDLSKDISKLKFEVNEICHSPTQVTPKRKTDLYMT